MEFKENIAFIEVGVEEMPPWFISSLEEFVVKAVGEYLGNRKVPFENVELFTTPRRIGLRISGLPERTPDELRTVTGPPVSVSIDGGGNYLKPAIKFAEKNKVGLSQLKVIKTHRGEYIGCDLIVKGKKIEDVIAEMVPAVFNEKTIHHEKSMKWSDGIGPFVRPIRWLVVLFMDRPVKCSLYGIESSHYSFGHRFHHPDKIKIEKCIDYESLLEKAFVIVPRKKRKDRIREILSAVEEKLNGRVVANEQLLDEVTDLVEYPVEVVGQFPEKYLQLPREVILTVMAKHQRYFGIRKKDSEILLPNFIAIGGTDPLLSPGGRDVESVRSRKKKLTEGYERVVTARLEDAMFFFNEDMKVSLSSFVERLEGIVFQKGCGNYRQKVERIREVARFICERLCCDERVIRDVDEAAFLSKADLATSMVYEFPELQGVMGGIYHFKQTGRKGVSTAIAEHYLPASAVDTLPVTKPGIIVSLSDKIDSVIAHLCLGFKPTSVSDPFGIRRLCISIIRLIIEKHLKVNIKQVAAKSFELVQQHLDEKLKKKVENPVDDFMEFLKDRLKYVWKEKARSDFIEAVISCGVSDLVKASKRLDALLEFRKTNEFEDLAVAFKRAYRISKEMKDVSPEASDIDTALFEKKEEFALFDAVKSINTSLKDAIEKEDFTGAYTLFRTLRDPIDRYFDSVFVNVEDEKLRSNRIKMMKLISDMIIPCARLDLIQFGRTRLVPKQKK